ncbi:hypothetical protein B0H67DRAFT_577950 [Lasiosphaeris hirsuta]|uniref:Uncharacterized protein n=1 Tax=Lasiosphaeris hirsuta TaxID=260670 RepID=A0AA40AS55_9PEZI|nr:hypothetical protein B0H67DRAFT_577950 [Lasiosphaeris hirsuta]
MSWSPWHRVMLTLLIWITLEFSCASRSQVSLQLLSTCQRSARRLSKPSPRVPNRDFNSRFIMTTFTNSISDKLGISNITPVGKECT